MKNQEKIVKKSTAKDAVDNPRGLELRHQLNYQYNHKVYGEHNNLPSGTKPDLSLSITEILHKYTSGRPLPQLKDYDYHQDVNLPDIRTLDLVEREELYNHVKKNVEALEASVNEKEAKRKKLIQDERTQVANLINWASEYEKEKISKAGDKA